MTHLSSAPQNGLGFRGGILIEIFGLFIGLGIIGRVAKRRDGTPWLWIIVGLVGYFLCALIFFYYFGSGYVLFGMAWLGLTLAGAFYLTGGLKSAGMSWICARCGLFNDPSTLVCDCGKRFDD